MRALTFEEGFLFELAAFGIVLGGFIDAPRLLEQIQALQRRAERLIQFARAAHTPTLSRSFVAAL